ncbi:MAG: Glycerophosphoryl diester phosphodiesterase [Verrucomicrobiales bacterium]|nr:Glycerophosphoryl diester phosphodiesterase [Verrucomicrobiales bacterium]
MKRFNISSSLAGIIAAVCVTLPSPAVEAPEAKTQWTVRGHVPPDKFVIQSHRGAGELVPENTQEAFELGWKLGTVPESDLRTTKDGVIVTFHDGNFKRTVKNVKPAMAKKGVVDITYAELSKFDVGGWKGEEFNGRHVPKVSDIFKLMTGKPERLLHLDIKNIDLQQLAKEVREHKVEKQVIFTTPKHDLMREWKKIVPESQTLLWMGGTEEELKKRFEELRAADFSGITELQIHVRLNTNSASAEPFNLSRDFIRATGEELRGRKILFQCLPWGVTDAKVYWQLLDLGVESFATDFPKITLQAVRDYYEQKSDSSQIK